MQQSLHNFFLPDNVFQNILVRSTNFSRSKKFIFSKHPSYGKWHFLSCFWIFKLDSPCSSHYWNLMLRMVPHIMKIFIWLDEFADSSDFSETNTISSFFRNWNSVGFGSLFSFDNWGHIYKVISQFLPTHFSSTAWRL